MDSHLYFIKSSYKPIRKRGRNKEGDEQRYYNSKKNEKWTSKYMKYWRLNQNYILQITVSYTISSDLGSGKPSLKCQLHTSLPATVTWPLFAHVENEAVTPPLESCTFTSVYWELTVIFPPHLWTRHWKHLKEHMSGWNMYFFFSSFPQQCSITTYIKFTCITYLKGLWYAFK